MLLQAIYTYPTNTTTKNSDEGECLDLVAKLLTVTQSAILTTANGERIELSLERCTSSFKRSGTAQVHAQTQESRVTKAAIEPHDRQKKHLIDSSEPFLASLGITTS